MKKEIDLELVKKLTERFMVPMEIKTYDTYYEGVYVGFNPIVGHAVKFQLTFNEKNVEGRMLFDTRIFNTTKKFHFEKMYNKSIRAIVKPDGKMVLEVIKKTRKPLETINLVLQILVSEEVNIRFEEIRMAALIDITNFKNSL